jgi:outer membrane receptor protein involved in Fe transport
MQLLLITAIVGNLASSTRTFNVTSPDSGFVEGATRLRTVQEKDLALFANDQWRLRNNLTLTYGVRWDYMGVPTVPNGLAIQPNFNDLYGISGFGNLFNPTADSRQPNTGRCDIGFCQRRHWQRTLQETIGITSHRQSV